MECMLHWDIKKNTSKGKGILGTVVASLQQMKNKAEKVSIATGKYGSKKSTKHYATVCFMKMIL